MAKPHEIGGAFRFAVELDGLLVGGFTEVSGVQAETETMEYAEGGLNSRVHILPKQTKFPRIVLKRGLTQSSELWDWYEGVMKGSVERKSGAIILGSYAGKEICRWNFFDAYPVKWVGPELNATGGTVAIESIEIVHNGIKAIFNKK
jgi:phage tail-like protein